VLAFAAVIALFVYRDHPPREIVVPFMIAILLTWRYSVPLVAGGLSGAPSLWPKLAGRLPSCGIGLLAVVMASSFSIISQVPVVPDLQEARRSRAYGNFKRYLLASPLHLTNSKMYGLPPVGVGGDPRKQPGTVVSGAVSFPAPRRTR
jgi:hypothetical protein